MKKRKAVHTHIHPNHMHLLQTSISWRRRFGKPNMQLFLIRHGRASGNHYHLFNGNRNDLPLTALGRKQAKKLADEWPKASKPDVIFCSTMKRARSTAKPLAKRFGMRPRPLSALVEQNFGSWSGKSALQMKESHPSFFFKYSDGRLSHFVKTTPDGESWQKVIARARKFLMAVKCACKRKKVVVVSHGVFLIACVHVLTGIKPPKLFEMRFGNTGVAKVSI